ncbi:CASP-like protein isoform F [Glycine soja]|nr:CASP-like protein isoform E [Glycine soja]RZB78601.1 CASP-like protein isoform F [Glycine soja]
MGLVIPWSITLLVVDAYSVFIQYLPVQRRLIMIIFFGDMMLSCLSLAAACSTASIADLLLDAGGSHCPPKLCGRYQLSAAMAFLSWFLSSVSFLFNFWLFSSL